MTNDKDAIEGVERAAVCFGRVSVTVVQAAMAADWTVLMAVG